MDYHDWTLLDIKLFWASGRAEIRLKGPDTLDTVVFQNISEFQMSRKFAWGKSESVNTFTLTPNTNTTETIGHMEMQSGDVLTIKAENGAIETGKI